MPRRTVHYSLRIEDGDRWWELGQDVYAMDLDRRSDGHRFAVTLWRVPEPFVPIAGSFYVCARWGPDNAWAGKARLMEHRISDEGLHTLGFEGSFNRLTPPQSP